MIVRITLIRHGETEENRRGIIQGQRPGTLSRRGREQVRELVKIMATEKIDAIYSSDLKRCKDTALPLHQNHPDVSFHYDKNLRELSFGRFEGLPVFFVSWGRRIGSLLNIRAPGGESWGNLRDRMREFLNKTYKSHPNDHIVIVTHGGPIRAARQLLTHASTREIMRDEVDNCSRLELAMKASLPSKSLY